MNTVKSFNITGLQLHMLDKGDSIRVSGFPVAPTVENNFLDKPQVIITKNTNGSFDLFVNYFARQFAEKMSHWVKYVGYPAEWEAHGKAAGPIRNAHMLSDFKPDLVVAFPGGRGTADMVKKAQDAGVTVLLVGKNFPL